MRARFLASLRETPNVSLAGVNAGIARNAAYEWREDDAKFAVAWEDALSVAVGYLDAGPSRLDRPRRGQGRAVRAPRPAAEIGPGRPTADPTSRDPEVRLERRQESRAPSSAPPSGSGASARA